jgi:translation initiation factor IF-1
MKSMWLHCLGLAAACAILTSPALAQNQDKPVPNQPNPVQVQPNPVRVQPNPVQQPTQPAQPAAEPARTTAQPPAVQPAAGTNVHGKIVRMEGNDKFVVRTDNNQEVTFVTNPQTRYLMKDRAARFSDLRVGADISAVYSPRDNVNYVNSVTIGDAVAAPVAPAAPPPAAPPQAAQPVPAQPTVMEGTIVRVVGRDQVVVRTADGKEVIVYVNPQTKLLLNDRPVEFTEFRAGAPIRVDYDVRNRRFEARRILGLPRR